MPVLMIRSSSGARETRVLSKDLPLAIGRHSSNDIQVDEDGVATLHCRISWGGKEFQIASANSTGVVVNNQLTFRSDLKEGDLIKVGSLEMAFHEQAHAGDLDDIPLEQSRPDFLALPAAVKTSAVKTPPKGTKVAESTSDSGKNAALTGEIVQEESLPPPVPKKKKKRSANPVADSLESLMAGMEKNPVEMEGVPLPKPESKRESIFTRKPVRPGERDLTRSPLVMTLGIGTLVLVLVSLTLLFLVKRESAQQAFDAGLNEFKQKRFSVSIERFDEFLKTFPRHDLTKTAVGYSNLAKVEQVLAGSAPDWNRAVSLLEQYVRSIRELSNFSEMQVYARDAATRIALSAADGAGLQKKRELIETSTNAARILEMNSPADQRPADKLKQIADAQVKSERIIRRHEFIRGSLEKIGASLERRESLAALQEYRKLVDDYPDSVNEAEVAARFQEILKLDQSLVKTTETDQAPLTADEAAPFPELLLTRATKARADLADSGVNVFALIGSACYAVDSGTGAIRWKRTVGENLPFAPIAVTNNVLCVLFYDARQEELVLVQQRDGKLVWRLPLKKRIQGNPLVHEGRILFLAEPALLMQVELATGACTKVVEFPQPVVGAPVFIERENRLIVAGRQQFTYVLDVRSLDCLAVVPTGQRDNAIQSSPIRLGHFVLFPEIDRSDATRLAVWDFTQGDPREPVATSRVPGHVRDQSVLRGKQLFVPSTGERVTSFTVSEQPGTSLLTRTAGYQVPNGGMSACFLKPGPEDELWMGSSVIQRLELSVDSIVPSGGQLSIGATTQPLQVVDQDLVIVGHPKGVRSFAIIGADRRQMTGRWQLLFGGRGLHTILPPNENGNVGVLADGGDFYEFSPSIFDKGAGKEIHPVASLPDRPEGYGELTAIALPKKGMFITAGLPEPHWWLMNPAGQIVSDGKLTEVPQCRPVPFADGVVLPLEGKLVYLDPANSKRRIENFIMARGEGAVDRWVDLQPEDATHFIGATRSGRLSRFQLQSEPSPHVFELSHVDRGQSSDFPPARSDEKVYTAVESILECWNSGTWEKDWSIELTGTVSGKPRLSGGYVLVETDMKQLRAYRQADGSLAWETEIDSSVAGDVVIWKNTITVPLASGTIVSVPENEGSEQVQRWGCGRNLSGTVLVRGESLLLSSDDGSWIRVDQPPGGAQ